MNFLLVFLPPPKFPDHRLNILAETNRQSKHTHRICWYRLNGHLNHDLFTGLREQFLLPTHHSSPNSFLDKSEASFLVFSHKGRQPQVFFVMLNCWNTKGLFYSFLRLFVNILTEEQSGFILVDHLTRGSFVDSQQLFVDPRLDH